MCGACLVMGLSLRCPVLHLCSMLDAELWLLSDKPLYLCYCRLQTLQPQGFQLLCSGHSWENYEAEYQHVLLNVHRELRELEGLGMREQVEQQLQQRFLE